MLFFSVHNVFERKIRTKNKPTSQSTITVHNKQEKKEKNEHHIYFCLTEKRKDETIYKDTLTLTFSVSFVCFVCIVSFFWFDINGFCCRKD